MQIKYLASIMQYTDSLSVQFDTFYKLVQNGNGLGVELWME